MLKKALYRVIFAQKEFWAHKETNGYKLLEGDPISEGIANLHPTTRLVPEHDIQLLPPSGRSKVLALAFNYKSIVGEKRADQEPLFFFKSITSLIGSGHPVKIPAYAERVWVEVELALIIGKQGSNIPSSKVGDYILGYTIGDDITAGNLYGRDHHLARSKGLDGFCPLGPALIPGIPPVSLQIQTTINGRMTQNGNTNDRILDDVSAVELISKYVTLEPGDVILTGTCAGAMDSIVTPGDEVTMSIEGIGVLVTNFV